MAIIINMTVTSTSNHINGAQLDIINPQIPPTIRARG